MRGCFGADLRNLEGISGSVSYAGRSGGWGLGRGGEG